MSLHFPDLSWLVTFQLVLRHIPNLYQKNYSSNFVPNWLILMRFVLFPMSNLSFDRDDRPLLVFQYCEEQHVSLLNNIDRL